MKIFKWFKEWFFLYLGKRFLRVYSRNCYTSIEELPIWYWKKIHDEGNLSYLIRSGTVHIKKRQVIGPRRYALAIIWRKILDQYITRFNFAPEYLEQIRKEKELAMYRIQRIVYNDKSVNAYIKICEGELRAMESDSPEGDFFELKSWVDKEWGRIDPMVVTVAEFYTYVKILKQKKRKAVAAND